MENASGTMEKKKSHAWTIAHRTTSHSILTRPCCAIDSQPHDTRHAKTSSLARWNTRRADLIEKNSGEHVEIAYWTARVHNTHEPRLLFAADNITRDQIGFHAVGFPVDSIFLRQASETVQAQVRAIAMLCINKTFCLHDNVIT